MKVLELIEMLQAMPQDPLQVIFLTAAEGENIAGGHNPDRLTVEQVWSKPEHVPPVCWLRAKDSTSYMRHLIIGITEHELFTQELPLAYSELSGYEYSTDLKTWKECVV